MGKEITYPIYDKIYNYIKDRNGNSMYLSKLYTEIENIKMNKEDLDVFQKIFSESISELGFTKRQIEFLTMNIKSAFQKLRFNRSDTRYIVSQMKRLGYFEVEKLNIVHVRKDKETH